MVEDMVKDMVEDIEIVDISLDECKKHVLGHGWSSGCGTPPQQEKKRDNRHITPSFHAAKRIQSIKRQLHEAHKADKTPDIQ